MVSTTSPLRAPVFKTERAGDRKPFKPKAWSHQRKLENLKGRQIDIVFIGGGDALTGTLLDADQFALELEIAGEDRKSVLTVFKHEIRFFRVRT
jgi:riboflavin biosynthesis pyrimidine reductase